MRRKKDMIFYLDAEEVDIILLALEAKEKEIKSVYATVPIYNIPLEYQAIRESIPKIKKCLKSKLLKWIGKVVENETY